MSGLMISMGKILALSLLLALISCSKQNQADPVTSGETCTFIYDTCQDSILGLNKKGCIDKINHVSGFCSKIKECIVSRSVCDDAYHTCYVEERCSEHPDEESSEEICCRICVNSKACGDSCISYSYQCHQGRGCACND